MYKLLICDDEPLERKALRLLIERHYSNIQLLEDAANGLEAIWSAHLFSPDIILMDISMPQCNGLDAQKEIIRFLPHVSTIFLTAYNDFAYAQQAIRYKVKDFLLKPVSPDILYLSLDQVFESMTARLDIPSIEHKDDFQKILDYIEAHFLDDITLKQVAEHFHFSEKYFSRYFKQKMDVSYTQYLTSLKIRQAKYDLQHTDTSLYEIAMKLNFSDASYFTRVFRNAEGITPSEYRRLFYL